MLNASIFAICRIVFLRINNIRKKKTKSKQQPFRVKYVRDRGRDVLKKNKKNMEKLLSALNARCFARRVSRTNYC